MLTPKIACCELPPFDAENLEAVCRAFQTAAPCAMQQAWLAKPEADFSPAAVRTGWRPGSLLIFAELTDVDIFTRATTLNERLWELGDTLEIFLRPVEQQAYVEFHVAPNNQRLQLRFADATALKQAQKDNSFEKVLIPGDAFGSRSWVRPELKKWFVYAEVPAKSVCVADKPLAGSRWHFSFSRYDYTHGRKEPVISSTSGHLEPNFHRQQEWGILNFCAPKQEKGR